MPWTRSSSTGRTLSCVACEKVRIVASKCAVSGMMFSFVPAWKEPTVTTIGSKMSNLRVTAV